MASIARLKARCVEASRLLEGDGEGFQVGALVVELGRGGGDFFYNEGVAGDAGFASVHEVGLAHIDRGQEFQIEARPSNQLLR